MSSSVNKTQAPTLVGESLWVQEQFIKQGIGLEICQCRTEKIISRSSDNLRMRASLLALTFANQLIYTHYKEKHNELVQEFDLPSLKSHPSPGSHASPNWFLYKKLFNQEAMSYFSMVFQGCMRSLTFWLRERLERYTPELHHVINIESENEFGALSSYFVDRSGVAASKVTIEDFHPEYLKTRFQFETYSLNNPRVDLFGGDAAKNHLPDSFAIISAFATTGESWTDEESEAADKNLFDSLSLMGHPIRVIAYSTDIGHREPSWCIELSWNSACDIGLKFKQDAIYYVRGTRLFLSFCDDKRILIDIGSFHEHLD